MPIYTPPQPFPEKGAAKIVFLAGSIEQGRAENWQADLGNKLTPHGIIVLNPRREQWDATWEQSIHNPLFKEQVDWELAGLEQADVCLFYFSPGTYSPITLLELGLCAASQKCIVCCPTGFWRKGNVDIICEKYALQQTETLEGLYAATLSYFNS